MVACLLVQSISWYMEEIDKWISHLHLSIYLDYWFQTLSDPVFEKTTLLVHSISMGFVDIFLLNQQVFISLYPAEVWLLWKRCWTLSYSLHIFFLSLGFHPKPILFNLPAAALEVTSVQIYTLYHGWHVVCVSVYLKPSSNCLLPIISDFFLQSIIGW